MKPALIWNRIPKLTPGMKNLGNQFNKAFPFRDGTSDGAPGDYAHSKHPSGHNPDDTPGSKPSWEDADKIPDIRSIDVDNNLLHPTITMQDVINHMRKLPKLETVVRYMIYDELIYHERDDFEPKPYTGASPHKEHAHFEGAYTELADRNTSFNFQFDRLLQGDDLPMEQTEFNKLLGQAIKDIKIEDFADPNDPNRLIPWNVWIGYSDKRADVARVEKAVAELDKKLTTLNQQLVDLAQLIRGNS